MKEVQIARSADKIRLSDWAHLRSELIWVYEGEVKPEYREVRHHFPGQSAFLIRKGAVVIETDKGRARAAAGQWVFPKQGNRLQNFSDDARILSVHFYLEWPGGQPLFDWDAAVVLHSKKAPGLESETKRLQRQVEHAFPGVMSSLPWMQGDLKMHLWLQQNFASWICTFADTLMNLGLKPSRLGPVDHRALQAIQWLDQHQLEAEFDERKLAVEIGLSVSQLDRLFAKQFGLTPRQHIDRRRLDAATQFLQGSSSPVKQISYELGFTSLAYFSRWFRAKTGSSPRQFQKLGRHEAVHGGQVHANGC